jgi:Protein of unknown function (DUF1161)
MKALAIAAVFFLAVSSYAQAPKPCEELKVEIGKKLEEKGVKSYSLEIVDKDKEGEGKTIGTCERGTKKIVYSKSAASTDAKETKK